MPQGARYSSSMTPEAATFTVQTFQGIKTITIKGNNVIVSDQLPDPNTLEARTEGAIVTQSPEVAKTVGDALIIANTHGKGGKIKLKDAEGLEKITTQVFEFMADGFNPEEQQLIQKTAKDSKLTR